MHPIKQWYKELAKELPGVAQVDLPGTEWEFVVFDIREPNAFAMPGGKVGVNSGLIALANGNEDEVAAVLGHEIAHVAFRHSNKRMSQAMGIALGGVILNTAMRNKSSTDRMLASGAYGLGTTVGMALPFSRSQEQEADHRGLYYAAMAGYDPRGAISFWKKMQGGKKRKTPEFLSTHPNPGNRIEFLEANMDKALAIYREAKNARGEKPNP
jgi:predicted Zn-dependent protease